MAAAQFWFVYYKVPREVVSKVTVQARQAMRALPVVSRLMQRIDESDRITLMEIYEGIEDAAAFGTALANALAASGMACELINARHVEVFSMAD